MKSFLQEISDEIVTKFGWEHLSELTLVFPTRRAGLVMLDWLKRKQDSEKRPAIWAPKVTTLSELFDSISPLESEDDLTTICRLYDIYRKEIREEIRVDDGDRSPISFDLFYGWGEQLLADFGNIDKSVSNKELEQFWHYTMAAERLDRPGLDDEVIGRLRDLFREESNIGEVDTKQKKRDSVRDKFEQLWQHIGQIYTALNKEMQAAGVGYEGARMRATIDRWDETSEKRDGQKYVFIGFNYLLPIEKELMHRLVDQATFYWDYVENFTTNRKAYAFVHQNIKEFGEAKRDKQQSQKSKRKVEVISASTRHAEAAYVHPWLRENYQHTGNPTAIVICDEGLLEPVVYSLPEIRFGKKREPINITKGFALSNTEIYSYIRKYLHGQDPKQKPIALLEFLNKNLQERLVSLGIPDKPNWQDILVRESIYQARIQVNKLIQALTDSNLSNYITDINLTSKLLCHMMDNVSIPFHGEPISEMQVMGVLESRMLEFNNLLLLGVEEGIVPQQMADMSFIPFYLRKAYGMQTHDERASVYAYNLFRLLHRAEKATIVFTAVNSNGGSKGMSRFVMQMMVSPEFDVTLKVLNESSQIVSTTPYDRAPKPKTLLAARGGQSVYLSPSAINTFIRCQRQFYLQYIVGIREQDNTDVIFPSSLLGSFLHELMHHIYTEIFHVDGKDYTTMDAKAIHELMESDERMNHALEKAYEKMNDKYKENNPEEKAPYRKEEHPMENSVLLGFARNILGKDAKDAQDKGLQIYQLETPHYFDIPLKDNVGTVRIGGIIDRLDLVNERGSTRMRVVDYKTGSYSDKKMRAGEMAELFTDEDKHYILQTMLYSESVRQRINPSEPIQPNLFFTQQHLSEENIQTTVVIGGEEVNDYETKRDEFLEGICELVNTIVNTSTFAEVPEGECNQFCPMLTICGREAKTH